MNTKIGLQEIFAQNFERTDVAAAKKWYHLWCNEYEQVLPGDTEPEFTMRAIGATSCKNNWCKRGAKT